MSIRRPQRPPPDPYKLAKVRKVLLGLGLTNAGALSFYRVLEANEDNYDDQALLILETLSAVTGASVVRHGEDTWVLEPLKGTEALAFDRENARWIW